jgi:hypothetical protein
VRRATANENAAPKAALSCGAPAVRVRNYQGGGTGGIPPVMVSRVDPRLRALIALEFQSFAASVGLSARGPKMLKPVGIR